MDDKTKRVGAEQMSGRGDDYLSGRGDEYPDRQTGSVADHSGRDSAARRTRTGRPGGTSDDESPDVRVREIRSEIKRTREDMSETVNAIQERLSPRHMVSEAVEGVKTAATDTVRSVAESEPIQYARANPIPLTMLGVGVVGAAWLALGGRNSRPSGYRRPASSTDWRRGGPYPSDEHTYGAQRLATAADGSDSESGYTTRNMSYQSDLRRLQAGQHSGEWSSGRVTRILELNPLLVGATTALIGAMIGMALPETERENELMGQARDSVVSGVQETVRDTVTKVKDATTEVIGKVTGDTPDSASHSGQSAQPGQDGQYGSAG
jgi:hypothetical protein